MNPPRSLTIHAPHTASDSPSTWMQVLSDLHPKYGGVSVAVPALANALAYEGVQTSIAAFGRPDEQYVPPELEDVAVSHWPSSRKQWWSSSALQSAYDDAFRSADGAHIHGLWQQSSIIASRNALAQRKPYIVSAHGMLEPWALGQHRLRKQIYSLLTERGILQNANCLHALTTAEAVAYRRYAGPRTVAVIPNGVSMPSGVSSALFLNAYPALAGKRILLFLARLHPKKGVDLLVRAFLKIASLQSDTTLVIAGPDADGMRAHLETLTASHGDAVLFTGMLDAQQKWSALAAAECFVLPSYSEGLSMGVLEAMAAGKPILLTPQCNMPEVAAITAGWLVEPVLEELTEALRFILSRSPAQNADVGSRGRDLVRRNYTWQSVAQRMADVYGWLQGGPLPSTCEVLQ